MLKLLEKEIQEATTELELTTITASVAAGVKVGSICDHMYLRQSGPDESRIADSTREELELGRNRVQLRPY